MYAENLANISRETGLELTTYSNELAVIDLPYGAIRMRTFPWMLWVTGSALSAATAGAGLQGFMQPTINGIGTLSNIDDENVPWTSIDANAYPGRYNISGLWFMTYPSRLSGVQPPVPSIRWQMLRQGLQDVERFVLLDELVRNARQQCQESGSAAICDAADTGWAALQSIKEKGIWDLSANFNFEETEYTHDPSTVESILLHIGDACERLLQLGAHTSMLAPATSKTDDTASMSPGSLLDHSAAPVLGTPHLAAENRMAADRVNTHMWFPAMIRVGELAVLHGSTHPDGRNTSVPTTGALFSLNVSDPAAVASGDWQRLNLSAHQTSTWAIPYPQGGGANAVLAPTFFSARAERSVFRGQEICAVERLHLPPAA